MTAKTFLLDLNTIFMQSYADLKAGKISIAQFDECRETYKAEIKEFYDKKLAALVAEFKQIQKDKAPNMQQLIHDNMLDAHYYLRGESRALYLITARVEEIPVQSADFLAYVNENIGEDPEERLSA